MRAGRCLTIACGFVFLVSITCVSQNVLSFAGGDRAIGTPAKVKVAVVLLPFSNPLKPTAIEQAYLDSFSILRSANSCSAFYGGSSAIAALNELTQQLRPTRLDRHIGIRMTGESTIVTSFLTGFTFRTFAKAEVNLDGPFYQMNTTSSRRIPQIGPFDPNTREARVTVVLHELGHLIRQADGKWVLPNDGNSTNASEANTERVLKACVDQIKELHNFSFEEELLRAQAPTPLESTVARRF